MNHVNFDQSKAGSTVAGFIPIFCGWITVIYSDICSVVRVNADLSVLFIIMRLVS